jgi:hypothetical protein
MSTENIQYVIRNYKPKVKKQNWDLEDLDDNANYYDVYYFTQNGYPGLMTAMKANSVHDASIRTSVMLTWGTTYSPEVFSVYKVIPTPKENLPE